VLLKRPYSKPTITFDSFSLSSALSSGCSVRAGNQSNLTCGVKFGNSSVFVAGVSGCGSVVGDGDGACYHVPSDPFHVFGS